MVLPSASGGLILDEETVCVAVTLRLGLDTCVPHTCRCDTSVDVSGRHELVCKQASGRFTRHQAVKNIVSRAFVSAEVPTSKEPVGFAVVTANVRTV